MLRILSRIRIHNTGMQEHIWTVTAHTNRYLLCRLSEIWNKYFRKVFFSCKLQNIIKKRIWSIEIWCASLSLRFLNTDNIGPSIFFLSKRRCVPLKTQNKIDQSGFQVVEIDKYIYRYVLYSYTVLSMVAVLTTASQPCSYTVIDGYKAPLSPALYTFHTCFRIPFGKIYFIAEASFFSQPGPWNIYFADSGRAPPPPQRYILKWFPRNMIEFKRNE